MPPIPKTEKKKRTPVKRAAKIKAVEAPPTQQLLAGVRHDEESDKAVMACNDYILLPNRSLTKLRNAYARQCTETHQNQPISGVPTESLDTLKKWSIRFDWRDRAVIWDCHVEHEKNEIHKASMRTGLALPYARVQALKEIFALLHEELHEEDETGRLCNLWQIIPRVLRTSDADGNIKLQTFYLRRYNAPLVSHCLKVLDEIAKETGGRRAGHRADELFNALIFKVGVHRLPDKALARMAAGECAFEVLLDTINMLGDRLDAAEQAQSGGAIMPQST